MEALAGDPALVRMMHTVDGVSAVTRLVMTATAKHRKKMVKGLKGLVAKVASDEYGRMVSAAAPVLTSNPHWRMHAIRQVRVGRGSGAGGVRGSWRTAVPSCSHGGA